MMVERASARVADDAVPRAFVWAIWLTLLVALLGFVVRYAYNLPQTEDWLLVPAITGNETDFFGSLWAQNNEHRVPFPRLVLIGVLWLARGDFRAGMLLNIGLVAGLAATFISLARRIRGGRTAYADALFPLALMHAGHWENFFWAWQATQVIPTVLPCIVLYCLAVDPWLARTRSAFVAGLCTMLLPLSGGNGLIFAPPLALWLVYTAFRRARAGAKASRFNTAVLLSSALVTSSLTALYFVGYQRPGWVPPSLGTTASLTAAAQFEAMSIGPVARTSWLLSAGVVLTFVLVTLAIAIPAVRRAKGEARQRAVAVVFFFLATLLFAATVGWGRSGTIQIYKLWPTRYAMMATTSLLVAAVIWLLFGSTVSTVLTSALALGLLVLLPLNVQHGLWWHDWYGPGAAGIEAALRSGSTAGELISRYKGHLNHSMPTSVLTERMIMLKRARMGLWNGLVNASGEGGDGSNLQNKSNASLVNLEVRYTRSEAAEVHVVWGVDGWHTTDIALQSGSTRVEKNLMRTPMGQRDGAFVAKIKIPEGARFNHGFLVSTGREGGFKWESAPDVVATTDTVIARFAPTNEAARTRAPLLKQTISYTAAKAGAVTLVWGVDGWRTVPEALRAGRAKLNDDVMVTQMERRGNSFVAEIDVPAGSVLNYGYKISDRRGVRDLISPLWDQKRSTQPVLRSDTLRDRPSVAFPDEFRDAARHWPVWLAGAALLGVLWPGFAILFTYRGRRRPGRIAPLG